MGRSAATAVKEMVKIKTPFLKFIAIKGGAK
jgi:hypothetical protein